MIKRFALLLSALLSLGLHAQAQTYPSPTVQNFTVLGTMTASGLTTSGTIANSLCQTSAGTVLSVAGVNCFGGGGGSLTLTDGTHTVTPTTQITVTGGTVGGSTPNATLTITGASGVTSVATAAPISGGTITGTGTISLTGPSNLTTFTANAFPVGAGASPFAVLGPPSSGFGVLSGWNTSNVASQIILGTNLSMTGSTLNVTGASGITQLTGDILAGPGSGSVSATLPTVNSNVGTFASETVNAKGQVTAAGNLTGDVTTSGAASTLATVNSNVGSFTNANITVNGKGLITAAANGSGGSGFAGYAGTTAGTANAQTIASPSPSGWTNTDQNQIFFKVGAGLTNTTAAPTLAISGQTAEPMDVQTGGALVSLPQGYLVAGLQYSATYQSGCTCYVVTTTPNSGVTVATTNQAPTSALWSVGQVYNLNAASLTVTPVVSTTLSPGGSIVINAINAGTLAATSPDTITTSAGTTGAGGNIALAAGTVTVVTSDGAGHLYAAGNTGGSGGITTLTGDVTAGPGSGSQAATLATVNSNVGTFASETVNGKGLVTAASALSGDLTTSGAVTTFATVNSNVGSFTNANITVNGKGLITAAANGTAGSPVIFVGAGAGTANAQTVATTTPSGFTLTNQFVVRFSAGATNTAAATLNVNSTGATAVDKQLSSGFAALSGGEIVSGLEYDATYNSTCTCFVLTNTPGSAIVNNATSATVTAVQWANGTLFNVTSAAQTITLPVATTLASNGNIFINAIGNSVTLAPNAADGINGGSTGASVTVASGVFAVVSTVGSSGTGAITANPLTGGSGSGTVNAGTSTHLAYYASSTNAVSSNTHLLENGSQEIANYATGGAAALAAQTGTALQLVGANATAAREEIDSYGAQSFFTGVCSSGTIASPTALTANTQCGGYNSYMRNDTGIVGPLASIRTFAAENQVAAGTHGGSYVEIATTPNGSQTMASIIRFENDGGITVPSTVTGGDKGAGTINATGLYIGGAAVSAAPSTAELSWGPGQNLSTAAIPFKNFSTTRTITAIVCTPEVAVGGTATFDVYIAASGTALSAGTKVNTTSCNANGTALTDQSLSVASSGIVSGQRIGIVATGGGWAGPSVGSGVLTVTYQ